MLPLSPLVSANPGECPGGGRLSAARVVADSRCRDSVAGATESGGADSDGSRSGERIVADRGRPVRRLDVAYLRDQLYLDPHPKELMLRNHV